MYMWQHQGLEELAPSQLDEVLEKLEYRRRYLLDLLPFDRDVNQSAIDQSVINEWLALLKERDRATRLKATKVSQNHFDSYMQEMQLMLGKISHQYDNHAPTSLRQTLKTLQGEIKQYLSSHNQGVENQNSKENTSPKPTISIASPDENIPTYTPPPLPDFTKHSARITPQSFYATPSQRRVQFNKSPATDTPRSSIKKAVHSTPKSVSRILSPRTRTTPRSTPRLNDEDLRKSLLKSKEKLRRTPGMAKSPGGTPTRRKPRLDLRNAGDLMTYALRKKFQNVRRLYGSPNAESLGKDDSINISID